MYDGVSYRKGIFCPCGHSWLFHDIEEYDGDGSDICCVQGCDQKACPGRQPKDGMEGGELMSDQQPAIPVELKQRPIEEQVALLAAEVVWLREKVLHTAGRLDGLGKAAVQAGALSYADAYGQAAKLVRRINDKSLLDAEES